MALLEVVDVFLSFCLTYSSVMFIVKLNYCFLRDFNSTCTWEVEDEGEKSVANFNKETIMEDTNEISTGNVKWPIVSFSTCVK